MPALALLLCLAAPVTLQSPRAKLVYDLERGVFSLLDRASGEITVGSAATRFGEWSTDQPGRLNTATTSRVLDDLSSGTALHLRSALAGQPTVFLDLTLYNPGFITLNAGLANATFEAVQLKEYHPLSGATAFPAASPKLACRTLNGPGGSPAAGSGAVWSWADCRTPTSSSSLARATPARPKRGRPS
ncbi:MAG: hypothetical protein HYU66_22775 [Armatimonadetes bacterium]|nr:hypothetical protein [Armatimonadota bacterium]